MKLAEALNLRADLLKRYNLIKGRINDNARVQEGDVPAEAPEELFAEMNEVLEQLQDLYYRINCTNMQAKVGDKTLTQLIAERDIMVLRLSAYRSALSHATIRPERYTRNEIRFIRAVDLKQLQKETDALAKAYRLLDMKIQEANWQYDLL